VGFANRKLDHFIPCQDLDNLTALSVSNFPAHYGEAELIKLFEGSLRTIEPHASPVVGCLISSSIHPRNLRDKENVRPTQAEVIFINHEYAKQALFLNGVLIANCKLSVQISALSEQLKTCQSEVTKNPLEAKTIDISMHSESSHGNNLYVS
jgi:hypothetical protein